MNQHRKTLAQVPGSVAGRAFELTLGFSLIAIFLQAAAVHAGPGSVGGADAVATQRTGETVFQQACFACHGTGLYGAPVVGDAYDWQDRLSKGLPVLLENTLQGMNNMPPRGACADCSDTEIEAAVRYLTDQ